MWVAYIAKGDVCDFVAMEVIFSYAEQVILRLTVRGITEIEPMSATTAEKNGIREACTEALWPLFNLLTYKPDVRHLSGQYQREIGARLDTMCVQ